MDEDDLQKSIEQYKLQLSQVEAILASNTHDKDDLESLKKDLTELIETSEESLLCLKKSKLFQLLDEVGEEDSDTEADDNKNFDEEVDQQSSDQSQIKEIEDALTGTQCQAPYTFDWGVSSYYNAMVLNIVEVDEETEGFKVCVLFTNPTHKSMVPCPYFLEGKCRFENGECRFSHGCIVNMNELKAYQEPDFSLLKVGDKCLAKYQDGVWYKATLLSINKDEVTVHYDTYNVDESLKLEDVLPISNGNIDESYVSDNESTKFSDSDTEENVIAEFCQSRVENTGALGEWEKHTKGIASKLMAKMGYVVGKGLGRNGEGRIEPVEIILLPTGKSLDACAELRQKKKLKEPFKKRTKPKNNSNTSGQVSRQNVFEFINAKLGGRKGDIQYFKQNHDQFHVLDRRKSGKQKSERNYNIELCKIEQEKSRIMKQIKKQKESVSRNTGRDATIVQQAKNKMDEMQQQLQCLENQEKLIKQKMHQKSEHKKLTVF